MKCFDDQWRRLYIEMIGASFQRNRKRCIEAGIELIDPGMTIREGFHVVCDMFRPCQRRYDAPSTCPCA